MKTFITTLYNSQTGHHSPPMLFETKEQAVSTFIHEIQMPDSELLNIKDRLHIKVIGRFEHTTGRITPYLFPKLLISGAEVTAPNKKDI